MSSYIYQNPQNAQEIERLLLNDERQDSWPPEEMNSIQGQRQGWITQGFLCNKVLLKYKA